MAEIKKNEIYEVRIEDMGHDGAGIGKINGYPLFVKDALIGDVAEVKIIKAKKNYAYARLMHLITPSLHRVTPRCPVARQCGGCQIQALDYGEQLLFKQRMVENNLRRIGGLADVEVLPVLGMDEPYRYRNKAQFPIGTDKEGNPVAGFYAGRTHSIIPCSDCMLGEEVNAQILSIVLDHMKRYHIPAYDETTGEGLVRHVLIRSAFATGERMVCLVLNGVQLPEQEALAEQLRHIPGMTSIMGNVNRERSNVILGNQVFSIWGKDTITDKIGDVSYQISPLSFYQVNPVQTRKLYETALSYAGLTGNETVWDLYCGIGTISLFLAQKAKKVYGVEIVPQAIEDARHNAKLNNIQNAEFFVGKSEEVLPAYYEENGGTADVIVVDPPRKGCDEALLYTIARMAPARVVYVSCDPATLARDLKYLCGRGYQVDKVQPVDMFGHTVHVETVVLLSHKKPDSVINVKVEFGEGEGKIPLDNIEKRAESYKPKERVTYKMIKEYIEAKHGFKVHTAYIAEVKRDLGLPMYDAPNAVEELKQPRKHPTAEKVEAIRDALKHFEVI